MTLHFVHTVHAHMFQVVLTKAVIISQRSINPYPANVENMVSF